jgi:hypothetical protein
VGLKIDTIFIKLFTPGVKLFKPLLTLVASDMGLLSESDAEHLRTQAVTYQALCLTVSFDFTELAKMYCTDILSSGGDRCITRWDDQQGRMGRYLGRVSC